MAETDSRGPDPVHPYLRGPALAGDRDRDRDGDGDGDGERQDGPAHADPGPYDLGAHDA